MGKKGSVFEWEAMKDKKKRSECTGRTGGFGRHSAPTPPEMALCILRGITSSYLRVDAAHGVAIDRCATIFDYEFGKHPEHQPPPGPDGQRASVAGAKVRCTGLHARCSALLLVSPPFARRSVILTAILPPPTPVLRRASVAPSTSAT
jgi:hypothetical protein